MITLYTKSPRHVGQIIWIPRDARKDFTPVRHVVTKTDDGTPAVNGMLVYRLEAEECP